VWVVICVKEGLEGTRGEKGGEPSGETQEVICGMDLEKQPRGDIEKRLRKEGGKGKDGGRGGDRQNREGGGQFCCRGRRKICTARDRRWIEETGSMGTGKKRKKKEPRLLEKK